MRSIDNNDRTLIAQSIREKAISIRVGLESMDDQSLFDWSVEKFIEGEILNQLDEPVPLPLQVIACADDESLLKHLLGAYTIGMNVPLSGNVWKVFELTGKLLKSNTAEYLRNNLPHELRKEVVEQSFKAYQEKRYESSEDIASTLVRFIPKSEYDVLMADRRFVDHYSKYPGWPSCFFYDRHAGICATDNWIAQPFDAPSFRDDYLRLRPDDFHIEVQVAIMGKIGPDKQTGITEEITMSFFLAGYGPKRYNGERGQVVIHLIPHIFRKARDKEDICNTHSFDIGFEGLEKRESADYKERVASIEKALKIKRVQKTISGAMDRISPILGFESLEIYNVIATWGCIPAFIDLQEGEVMTEEEIEKNLYNYHKAAFGIRSAEEWRQEKELKRAGRKNPFYLLPSALTSDPIIARRRKERMPSGKRQDHLFDF